MRSAVALFMLSLTLGFAHGAENPPPLGKNCSLVEPPSLAGEESNHGAILRIFPRARDIDSRYTGCQAMFAEYAGRWVVVSLTEVVQGDPVRIWSEHEAANPAMSCSYSKGKVVVGNPETCPMAEFILVKSLAPGCFQSIRESVAQQGLGAPWPTGCKYE